MNSFNKNLLAYTTAEETVLRARLDAIRAAVPATHRSEKGRSVELAVQRLFREILPSEYGLTTGFIAYHSADCIKETITEIEGGRSYRYRYVSTDDTIAVSSQLDLIIYDALRFAPLARLEGCDVLPFEAVLAYVEIKSWIDNKPDRRTGLTPLRAILKQSHNLRSIKTRLYWLSKPGKYTKAILLPYPVEESVPMRSFVFVLDTDKELSDWKTVKATLEEPEARQLEGFLSSMYIQNVGYFRSHHAEVGTDPLIGTFEATGEDALALFKISLFSGLSRFPRAERTWTPGIDRYYYNDEVESADVELIKKKGELPQVIIRYEDTEL